MPGADGDKVLIGRGAVYFDRFTDAGVSTGFRFLGNCAPFEYTQSDELAELYSSVESTSPLLKSVNKKRTIEFNIGLYEFTDENLALGLMGAESTLAQATGTATGEKHTTPGGSYTQLANLGVSSVTTDIGAEDTDFIVDEQNGLVYIVPDGLCDGVEITYAYSFEVITLQKTQIGSSNVIEGSLLFIGDPTTGPAYELTIWKASVTPGGTIGMISDDYASFPLKIKVLADSTNHPSNPYGRLIGLDPLIDVLTP
jgi:hypothetical protein